MACLEANSAKIFAPAAPSPGRSRGFGDPYPWPSMLSPLLRGRFPEAGRSGRPHLTGGVPLLRSLHRKGSRHVCLPSRRLKQLPHFACAAPGTALEDWNGSRCSLLKKSELKSSKQSRVLCAFVLVHSQHRAASAAAAACCHCQQQNLRDDLIVFRCIRTPYAQLQLTQARVQWDRPSSRPFPHLSMHAPLAPEEAPRQAMVCG